jgi:hypothetical protein
LIHSLPQLSEKSFPHQFSGKPLPDDIISYTSDDPEPTPKMEYPENSSQTKPWLQRDLAEQNQRAYGTKTSHKKAGHDIYGIIESFQNTTYKDGELPGGTEYSDPLTDYTGFKTAEGGAAPGEEPPI